MFGIQTILRCAEQNLSDKQKHRLATAIDTHEAHEEVFIAWQAAQRVRAVYHADTPAEGRAAARHLLDALPTCPIPKIARLGRTLKQWRDAFLAYFDHAPKSCLLPVASGSSMTTSNSRPPVLFLGYAGR